MAKVPFVTKEQLEENMISLPSNPQRSDIISSVKDEQSVPHPSSFKIFKIVGFGVAFTAEEFILAKQLGATINLDDITHIEFLKECAGIPEKISCRYNPGGVFALGTDIMDNPGDAKYGMTTEQIFEAFKQLKELGVKEFGIHSFLACNVQVR